MCNDPCDRCSSKAFRCSGARQQGQRWGKADMADWQVYGVQVQYFRQRQGPLATGGLSALKQSMAGMCC